MSIKSALAAMSLKAKIVIVCAAVAVTGGTAAGVGIAMSREEAYRVLKVFEMTGTAIVEREGSGELDAYTGMNLESGDTLTVSDDSSIRISLDDDKYILLDEGTVLELTATGTAADSRTSIDLKQGTILNEITQPLSANSSYEVTTPKSTMAVRGTSFMVSVERDANGGFIITENTFEGKVEVELIDPKGGKTGKTVLITPGKSVSVYTEPDETSGNPAEVDGISRFVIMDEDGSFTAAKDGEDPSRDINYNRIPPRIRNAALSSNDKKLMPLDDDIVNNLRGNVTAETTTTAATSETSQTTTTVPETSETESETTVTTVPETTITTTVPDTERFVPDTKPSTITTTSNTTSKTTVTTTGTTTKKTKKTTSTTKTTTEKKTETAAVTTSETIKTTTETTTETTETTTETTTTPTDATPSTGGGYVVVTTGDHIPEPDPSPSEDTSPDPEPSPEPSPSQTDDGVTGFAP